MREPRLRIVISVFICVTTRRRRSVERNTAGRSPAAQVSTNLWATVRTIKGLWWKKAEQLNGRIKDGCAVACRCSPNLICIFFLKWLSIGERLNRVLDISWYSSSTTHQRDLWRHQTATFGNLIWLEWWHFRHVNFFIIIFLQSCT